MHGQHAMVDGTIDVKDLTHIEERSDNSRMQDPDNALLASSHRTQAEKELVRKLDLRLLPTVILIYVMNCIDVSRIPISLWYFRCDKE